MEECANVNTKYQPANSSIITFTHDQWIIIRILVILPPSYPAPSILVTKNQITEGIEQKLPDDKFRLQIHPALSNPRVVRTFFSYENNKTCKTNWVI